MNVYIQKGRHSETLWNDQKSRTRKYFELEKDNHWQKKVEYDISYYIRLILEIYLTRKFH